MSEEQKQPPQLFAYRLITMNGLVVDFQSPNQLESMWAMFKSDGYFQMLSERGQVARRIPFHAIADLAYHDPAMTALAYAQPSSLAKN